MTWLGLRWTDSLDVLLVAGLVYAAIRWIRRSESALVAVGVAIVCAGWAAARALELRMTTWAFQGIFALFAVVLVVLFQEELRRAFETVAAWALGRRHDARPRLDAPHILVEALVDLARRRIGALVVLPGLQPLRRHLRGGTTLDGQLSAPLLNSLFDPHSDGHDGAVIVENRRVTQFGVQLPLAREVSRLGTRGTRHSAALGLVERSDALCLVVSEERGAISVAHRGELREVEGAAGLGAEIASFYRETLPLARRRPAWERWLSTHRAEKLAALGIAGSLWWLLVSGSELLDVRMRVPVELTNLPADARVGSLEPDHIDAVVRGQRRSLLWLGASGLSARVDASAGRQGDNGFVVSADDIRLPTGVSLTEFAPLPVDVTLELAPVAAGH